MLIYFDGNSAFSLPNFMTYRASLWDTIRLLHLPLKERFEIFGYVALAAAARNIQRLGAVLRKQDADKQRRKRGSYKKITRGNSHSRLGQPSARVVGIGTSFTPAKCEKFSFGSAQSPKSNPLSKISPYFASCSVYF